jgi:hypothetical protein
VLVGSGVLTQATLAEETAGFGGRGRRWRVLELRSCWGARLAHRIGSMHLEGCLGVVVVGGLGKEEGWRRWRSGGVYCLGRRSAGAKVAQLALAMALARRWIVMLLGRSRGLIQLEIESAL